MVKGIAFDVVLGYHVYGCIVYLTLEVDMLFKDWLLANVVVDGISRIAPYDLYRAWLDDEVMEWEGAAISSPWMTRQARLILGIKAKAGQRFIIGVRLKPADMRVKTSRPTLDKSANDKPELI